MAGSNRFHGVPGAADRGLGELVRMGVTGGLAGDRPKPKALGRIEARAPHPAVIEGNTFGLAIFQKKFPVVGAVQRLGDNTLHPCLIEVGAIEKQIVGRRQISHHPYLSISHTNTPRATILSIARPVFKISTLTLSHY